MKRMNFYCWDCKSILWPWQLRGIDGISHRECHRKRCRSLITEMPDMKREIINEINIIENLYAK
jgi:hypothetical protein